jgi:hypothetical protein
MKQDYKYFIKEKGYCGRSNSINNCNNLYERENFCKNECIFKICDGFAVFRYNYVKNLKLKLIRKLI